jgi:hypothetical protein
VTHQPTRQPAKEAIPMFLFLILFLATASFGGLRLGVDSRDAWRDADDMHAGAAFRRNLP